MSDRTMIPVGRKSVSVPRFVKRLLRVLTGVGITALVTLAIVFANTLLVARGTPVQGFNLWYTFITRPDIIGTIVLTMIVATVLPIWPWSNSERR